MQLLFPDRLSEATPADSSPEWVRLMAHIHMWQSHVESKVVSSHTSLLYRCIWSKLYMSLAHKHGIDAWCICVSMKCINTLMSVCLSVWLAGCLSVCLTGCLYTVLWPTTVRWSLLHLPGLNQTKATSPCERDTSQRNKNDSKKTRVFVQLQSYLGFSCAPTFSPQITLSECDHSYLTSLMTHRFC